MPLISMKSGWPRSMSLAYSPASSAFHPATSVSRYTVRWCLSRNAVRLVMNRSQKSPNKGRSMALSVSGVAASTDTYSCVMPGSAVMASGNCALVTRKVEMRRSCSALTNLPISGYIIGSPTSDSAQCRGSIPSWKRAGITPGTPFICLIIPRCSKIADATSSSGSSICHRHSRPTGLVWCRQQNTHLLAQASDGVASMQRCDSMP
mmetsp:Transcript_9442/g.23304  ORF Transcript_9442/g.23304 Transcript_9442/m.23304 type:complete len:206 (-) Transcript_9442:337-954(-)